MVYYAYPSKRSRDSLLPKHRSFEFSTSFHFSRQLSLSFETRSQYLLSLVDKTIVQLVRVTSKYITYENIDFGEYSRRGVVTTDNNNSREVGGRGDGVRNGTSCREGIKEDKIERRRGRENI